MLMAAKYLKALVQMCSFWRQSSVAMTFVLADVLGWIQEWEEIWEEILSEASAYRGLQGLEVRQRLRKKKTLLISTKLLSSCAKTTTIISKPGNGHKGQKQELLPLHWD